VNRNQPAGQVSNLPGFIGKTRTARATCTAAFGRPGSLICNNCDQKPRAPVVIQIKPEMASVDPWAVHYVPMDEDGLPLRRPYR
jgi:hypothetical protein